MNVRYSARWGAAARARELLGPDAYLGATSGWGEAMPLCKSQAIPKARRREVGEALGRRLRANLEVTLRAIDRKAATEAEIGAERLTGDAKAGEEFEEGICPGVVLVEKPLLEGFVAGFCAAVECEQGSSKGAADGRSPNRRAPPPFVLLLVNGGDGPVVPEMVRCLRRDGPLGDSLRCCYAHNLQQCAAGGGGGGRETMDPSRFRPLPLGIESAAREAVVLQAASRGGTVAERVATVPAMPTATLPWAERDARLLVAPMGRHGRFRAAYLAVLSADPRYAGLVRVVEGARLPPPAFMALLATHQAVLSPPGRGYDCFRTWEALALGTVPLVVRDEAFDQRLFEGTGAAFMPLPEELVGPEGPALLARVLGRLEDPAPHRQLLRMSRWRAEWMSHLR